MAASAIAIAYVAHAAGFADYVSDDGGISLAYARHYAEGQGLSINPGGVPVEGFSNPLWVFLLALAVRTGIAAIGDEILLKGLGLIFGAGVLCLMPVLARRAYGHDRSICWLAPALLVVWTPFVFWAGGGLENALYAFVLTLAAVLQLAEIVSQPRFPSSALALAAVAMTRPEGCAFFVAFLTHRIIATCGSWRVRRWDVVRWAALFVVLFGAFLVWRQYVFASWLPNTYYAKVWGRSLADLPHYVMNLSDRGWIYLIGFARTWWPVLVVAAAGLLDFRFWRGNLLFGGLIAGQALYIIYVGGDWWHAWRFMTPLLPFFAIAAQHGAFRAGALFARRMVTTVIAATVLVTVAATSVEAGRQLHRLHSEHWLIDMKGRRDQALRILEFARAAHIDRPSYLDADIGGLAVTGGMTIVDLGMLTDISLARFQYFPPMFRQYIFEERRPDFIRTHATWTRSSRLTEYPELFEQYLPISSMRDELGLHGEFVRKDLFVEPSDERSPLAHFGEISLVSFEPRRFEAAAGGEVTFTWRWRCDRGCSSPYRFEVLLDDGRGHAERSSFEPVFGWYPTDRWKGGETIRTTQTLPVPPRFEPGEYTVAVRMVPAADTAPEPIATATLIVRAHAGAPSPAESTRRSGDVDQSEDEFTPQRNESVASLIRAADEHVARREYPLAFDTIREGLLLEPSNVRLARRLEDVRERLFWIEYYGQTRRYPQLLQMFDEEWRAGTLPNDRARLEELHYSLLNAGDENRAGRLRSFAGLPQKPAIEFYEQATSVLSLVDYWFELRQPETTTRLHLYFKVHRVPSRDFDLLVDLESSTGKPTTILQPFEELPSTWHEGRLLAQEVMLRPSPGEYGVRVRLSQHDGTAPLCTDAGGTQCEVVLGRRMIGRHPYTFY